MASSKQENFEDEMNQQEYYDEICESGEEEELESTMLNVNKTIEQNKSTIHSSETAAASASTKQKKKITKEVMVELVEKEKLTKMRVTMKVAHH